MNEQAIEARGSDIEEAIQRGLKRLGLSRTDVIIDIVDEGRKGLLGLGSREAVVRLTPLPQTVAEMGIEDEPEWEDEEPAAAEAAPEPVTAVETEAPEEAYPEEPTAAVEAETEEAPLVEAAPALPAEEPVTQAPTSAEAQTEAEAEEVEAQPAAPPPAPAPAAALPEAEETPAEELARAATGAVDEELEEVLYEILGTLTAKMGFPDAQIDVTYSEPDDKTGRVMTVAEIEGSGELNNLIGAHGEVLSDLQYVVRLMAGHALKRRANFLIDINGYRRRRKEALTKLAERMAAKAVRRGEPVTLEAMNAYDRRIVHIALRDHEEVYTNSVGEGANRRVRVYLQE